MNYKEVYGIALPESKKKEERWNLWVYLVVRPLSVMVTAPLTNTKVKPTTITKWSIVSLIVGFFIICFARNTGWTLAGWMFFFIWAILDGVDGNLARCTKQCSALGDLWDTMGGYLAMVLMYFSLGIYAFFDSSLFEIENKYFLLILGGATAIMSIFPRLILHKKKSSNANSEAVKELSDQQNYSVTKNLAINLISPSGFMQVLILFGMLFHFSNILIAFYFVVNLGIMLISLRNLLK